ncbi:MAG TPA: Holliday junction branch migration protein RuvA [Myxococcaceae bacterium]|nr:Holliday junction branch migration protein RuvA [Myxococcaceae bacterium]
MIASLRGTVAEKGSNDAVIDVNGVGYRVFLSLLSLTRMPEVGEPAQLRIRTVVREDALDLFGFLTADEEALFLMLTSVSRVGPRLAMTILSGLEVEALLSAISGGEIARLSKIHGVGKKTAERVVLELRDKAQALARGSQAPAEAKTPTTAADKDVISALQNLGYKPPEAERGVALARERLGDAEGFERLFREALQALRKATH